MVYIKTWTQFESATIDLYNKSPRKARYVVKFVPKTGHLVLKVTDDTTCLMYKTYSAIILNRFESLNLRLLSSMGNVRRRPAAAVLSTLSGGSSGVASPAAVEGDDPMSGLKVPASTAPPAQASTGAKAGGKKKKKGGKK